MAREALTLRCLGCGWVEELPDLAAIAGRTLAHLDANPRCQGRDVEVLEPQLPLGLETPGVA